MAGGRGGGEEKGDGSAWLVGLALAFGVVWLLWTFARAPIAVVAFGLDWAQLALLDALGLLDPTGRQWLEFQRDAVLSAVGALPPTAPGYIDPMKMEWGAHFVRSSEVTGRRMQIPVALATGAVVAAVLLRMRGDGFRRGFTLTGRSFTAVYRILGWNGLSGQLRWADTRPKWHPARWIVRLLMLARVVRSRKEWVSSGNDFAGYQASFWKVTLVGARFDPDTAGPEWDQSMVPPEWMRANKIRLTRADGLDEEAAGRAFARQLGTAWAGVLHAPYHVQALCVLAALNRRWKVEQNLRLRNALAVAHAGRPAAAAAADSRKLLAPFLADKAMVRDIDRVCARSFHTNTATLRIYGWGGPFMDWGGGEGASFAPANVLWLKGVDRTLWYAIQQIGRRAFMVEGAGAVSHHFWEVVAKRPIQEPQVGGAIDGLKKYLGSQYIVALNEYFERLENID